MVDVDKMQNIVLKMPLFYTPASHIPGNKHNTMGNLVEQKLATKNSFHVFGVSIFAHSSPDILTKHNIKETESKGSIWVPFYIPRGEGTGGG